MWEFTIILCIATSVTGEPTNSCFGFRSQPVFETYNQCILDANGQMEMLVEFHYNASDPGAPVVSAVCIPKRST